MASSKTTPIFFADGAADTLSLSIQIEFRVGLGHQEDEITNNSDLSPFNFRLLYNIHLCMYVCHGSDFVSGQPSSSRVHQA